jgi:hypothetical protein
MRLTDLTSASLLATGRLVSALTDWDSTEAPTIYALYPRRLRQSKTARCFLEFLTDVFAEIEKQRVPEYHGVMPRISQPHWFGRAKVDSPHIVDNRSTRVMVELI